MAKKKDRTKSLSIGKFSISTSKNKDTDSGKKSKFLTVKVGDKTLYSRYKAKEKDEFKSIPTPLKEENYRSGRKQILDTTTNRRKFKVSTLDVGVKGDRGSISMSRTKTKYGRINQDVPGFKTKSRSISTNDRSGKGPTYNSDKTKGTTDYTTFGENRYNRKGKQVEKKHSVITKGKSKLKGKFFKSK
jgi:hypothetical protein